MNTQVKTTLLAKGSSIASHKKRGVSFSGTSSSRGLVCIIKVRLRKQSIITVPQVSTFISLQLLTFNDSLSHTFPMNSIRQVQALNKRELEHAM